MTPVDPDQASSREVTIRNRRGLHARAAAKFVRLAEQFDCAIEVQRNDIVVAGTSIMGLMMLAAAPGCSIVMRAAGADSMTALDALADLVDRRFDED